MNTAFFKVNIFLKKNFKIIVKNIDMLYIIWYYYIANVLGV